MPLKKRAIAAPSQAPTGAASLPGLMAGLPQARTVTMLPLESLTPAPDEWNFYTPLPDGKFIELIDSIQSSGLLHPIVVWQKPDGVKLVLSGHNRLRAYKELYRRTESSDYATIAATVLTDLSESEAREIVIDSNWVQRNLTPSEKARSIYQKYMLAGRKARSKNGTRRSNYDVIAEEYGLSGRQIARYVKLGSLPAALHALVDAGTLPIAGALKLVDYPAESQLHLAEHWPEKLRAPYLDRISPAMTLAELDAALTEKPAAVHVTVQVPAALEKRFRRMAKKWLAENAPQIGTDQPADPQPEE